MGVKAEIKGLKETQERMAALLQEISAGGGLEAIIAKATLRLHRHAVRVTHHISGRLRNSHYPRVSKKANDVYGIIGTNVIYASVEHERPGVKVSGMEGGGSGRHDFYARTIREEGAATIAMIEKDISEAVRRAGGG